jgi:hypothetical protein
MDDALRRALVGTAATLQLLAYESGIEQLREFDLKSALRRCLQLQFHERVVAELTGSAPAGFGGVSTVDLIVPNPRSQMWRAALELKWWSSPGKVRESLWDAYKVAALYRASRTDAAYLVAAGPASLWSQPLAALYTKTAAWSTQQMRSDHPAAFKELIDKGPDQLPAGINTLPIGDAEIVLDDGDPWLLRATRITTGSGAAYAVNAAC